MIFIEEVVVINPPIGAGVTPSHPLVYPMWGVAYFWPLTMATFMTCLSNLYKIISSDLLCPKTI